MDTSLQWIRVAIRKEITSEHRTVEGEEKDHNYRGRTK